MYTDLSNKPWFQSLDPVTQKFVETYKDKMQDGMHMIPTQATQVAGLRNAAVETHGFAEVTTTGQSTTTEVKQQKPTMRLGAISYNRGKTSETVSSELVQEVSAANATLLQSIDPSVNITMNVLAHESGVVKSIVAATNSQDITVNQRPIGGAQRTDTKERSWSELRKDVESFVTVSTEVKDGQKQQLLVNTCASGKDRTAMGELALTNTEVEARLKEYHGEKYTDEMRVSAMQNIVASRHHETIAGGDGASRGVMALKLEGVAGIKYGITSPFHDMAKSNPLYCVRDQLAENTLSNLNHTKFRNTSNPVLETYRESKVFERAKNIWKSKGSYDPTAPTTPLLGHSNKVGPAELR